MQTLWLRICSLLRKAVGDRRLRFTLLNQAAAFVRGPISAVLQLTFLTAHNQGVWYSFVSLGALSVMAELGFAQVVSQFVIHEGLGTSLRAGGVEGDVASVKRVVSLIRFAARVYFIIVPIATTLLVTVGVNFFSKEASSVLFSWAIYSIAGGLMLIIALFQAVVRGFDRVVEFQTYLLIQTVSQSVLTWILLAMGVQVASLAIGYLAASIVSALVIFCKNRSMFRQTFKSFLSSDGFTPRWGKKVFKVAWQNALAYSASYVIYQLAVPVVYRVDGAVRAGQLGMSLVLVAVIRGAAEALLSSRFPALAMLAARGEEAELLTRYQKLLLLSISVAVFGGVTLYIFMVSISGFVFSKRLLNSSDSIPVILYGIELAIIGFVATYNQLHNDSSLFWISILTAVVVGVQFFIVYPTFGFAIAYWSGVAIVGLVVIPILWVVSRNRYKAYVQRT